jgi:hypothetical protein
MPCPASDDEVNANVGDAVLAPETALGLTRRLAGADVADGCPRQLVAGGCLAHCPGAAPQAALSRGVAEVVAGGASPEVGRIAARGVVAGVEHVERGRDWAIGHFEGDPVGTTPLISMPEHPVSIAARAEPWPAGPEAARLVDLIPEAVVARGSGGTDANRVPAGALGTLGIELLGEEDITSLTGRHL